jgi:hypothetical protein
MPSQIDESELLSYLASEGYENLRTLPDGTIVGTSELMFTRAIYINLNRWSYDKRFCFEDRSLAIAELAKLNTIDDEPSGYVARRG